MTLFLLALGAAQAQTPFSLTLTNTSAVSWDEGLFAVLPAGASPDALLPIGQSPTSGDAYDTYAYVHASCDLYYQEDDGNAPLLITRWPGLTEGVNAFRVGPLGPGASQVVSFDASPGEVVSFVAHVTGSGDDAAILHALGDNTDATVDLFDVNGDPLTTVTYAIGGFDVNDSSPTGGGGSCAGSCPPSVPCYVSPGGGANGATAQPVTGGCVAQTYYPDLDGDGWGNGMLAGGLACEAPAGSTFLSGDCDDNDATVNPDALEQCGGVDEDCDGLTDDADPDLDPATTPTWYADEDMDGYGDPTSPIQACVQPGNAVANATDCDDGDGDNWTSCGTCVDGDGDGVFVGCDAYLSRPGPDCDDTDPALNNSTVWYDDIDGDGYGDPLTATVQCVQPLGAVANPDDCDDLDAAINPAATEVCGGGDEDCDALVDDADPSLDPTTTPTWYTDGDGDGYGLDASATLACTQPPGSTAVGGDCDDADVDNWISCATCQDGDGDGVHAGCDAYTTRLGPDCDDTDPALNNSTVWYDDLDGDGFGDPGAATIQCVQPANTVDNPDDCDDADPAVNPDAVEVCGGGDEDCDGLVDDLDPSLDPLTTPTWYGDADMDGAGDPNNWTQSCLQPPDTTDNGDDCDDNDDTRHPGAIEVCDGVDQDCDGVADDGAIDILVWYTDADADGYGDPASTGAGCVQPGGTVLVGNDCDDADPGVNPGATEVCDGVDQDCNGTADDNAVDAVAFFEDADEDGHGNLYSPTFACVAPPGFTASADDCDDTNDTVYPGSVELCDGVDQDCNGVADDGLPLDTWYADADADGWGDDSVTVQDCAPPVDHVDRGGDCNDTDPAVSPDATEIPGNDVDEDCDGVVDPGTGPTDTADTAVPPIPGDDTRDWSPSETGQPALPTEAGCGCATGSSGSLPGSLPGLLGLVLLGRRRRRL